MNKINRFTLPGTKFNKSSNIQCSDSPLHGKGEVLMFVVTGTSTGRSCQSPVTFSPMTHTQCFTYRYTVLCIFPWIMYVIRQHNTDTDTVVLYHGSRGVLCSAHSQNTTFISRFTKESTGKVGICTMRKSTQYCR